MSVGGMIPKSYTVRQAANELGVTESTVMYHLREGNLAAENIEHRLYISPAELRRFQRNRRGPGNPNFGRKLGKRSNR